MHIRRGRAGLGTVMVVGGVALLCGCHHSQRSEMAMEVRSVGYDNATHAPVVVLQDHDRKIALPIWIGPTEAQAIAMQIEGVNPPRPMTHDLLKTILDNAGVEVRRVLIGDLKESTYYAQIYLHDSHHDWQVDSRPSDAIALAVRFHQPIYVAASLLKGDDAIDLQHVAPAATTVKVAGVTLQNLTPEMAAYFGVPAGHGVVVADVDAGAAAALQRGDVVLEVDGAAITGVGDFSSRVQAADQRGTPAALGVQRGNSRVPIQFAAR